MCRADSACPRSCKPCRRMLTILDNLAQQAEGASLCFEDRHSLALAHGLGHAIAHSTFFYLWYACAPQSACMLEVRACLPLCPTPESLVHAHSLGLSLRAVAAKKQARERQSSVVVWLPCKCTKLCRRFRSLNDCRACHAAGCPWRWAMAPCTWTPAPTCHSSSMLVCHLLQHH